MSSIVTPLGSRLGGLVTEKPTIHELETLLDNEGRHARIEPDGSITKRVEQLETALRNLLSHCDVAPEGDTLYEQHVIAARALLLED